MIERCCDENNGSFHRYGGRGIRVCAQWLASYDSFLADMGPRPSPEHSLDRINNNGNYEPGNCRWATRHQQNRNRSDNIVLELDGRRKILADWARGLGITKQALRFRLSSSDWTYRDALTISERRQVRGERHRLAKLTDVQAQEIVVRRRNGEKIKALGDEYGVSQSRISKMARKAGVIELRKRKAK